MAYFSRPEDNTRKRAAHNNHNNEQSKLSDLDSSDKLTDSSDEVQIKSKKDLKVKIGLPDLDFNDPNFLKILKVGKYIILFSKPINYLVKVNFINLSGIWKI